MWKKLKESKFGQKCRELSNHKGAMASLVCLAVALVVIASVSVATNLAKKKYTADDSVVTEEKTEKKTEQMVPPTYNDGGANETVVGSDEEFALSLPVGTGTVSKNHDPTIQVWSDTMGDYRVHLGIDIVTSEAAPVFAAADGEVARIWDDALMGKCVAIAHDEKVFTIYKNLSTELPEEIKEGARVARGQKIGTIGESAISELAEEPHLHIEMTVDGIAVDPMEYFSKEAKDKLSLDQSYEDGGK